MAKLTGKQRDNLPASQFAIPPDRYPIDTKERAANALARVSQFGSAEEKKRVRAAVCKRYPDFGICSSMKTADRLKSGK